MHEVFVTKTDQLQELCAAWSKQSWLGVDTEFLRVRTYYPRLCLLQIATPGQIALVDPTADMTLEPLCKLFVDPGITKIVHAARQDIEVLFPVCQAPLASVFDTQIAAGLLGFGDQIGYAALVSELIGVQLPKGHTRADWCRRPLPPAQEAYAVDDVRYLGELFDKLSASLRSKGRESWCAEECARLSDPKLYEQDPALAFERTRIGANLPAAAQPILKRLAIWRERTAQRRNLPRNWIASDRQLADIALNRPRNETALREMEGITEQFVRHNGSQLLTLLASMDERPRPEIIWHTQSPLDKAQRRVCDQLMGKVREVAAVAGIAPAMLATRRDVEALVRNKEEVSLLQGWRGMLLREHLQEFLDDHLAGSATSTVSS